jgi:hypothetical protein
MARKHKVSAFNKCVGRKLKGRKFKNKRTQRKAFKAALRACKGKKSRKRKRKRKR